MQYSLVADHYQQLALIAVVALAAAGISKIETRIHPANGIDWLRIGAGGIAVVALSLLAALQSELYAGPIPLYTATLEKNPDCWMLHNNLGSALVTAGQPEFAIPHFKQALIINPKYPEAHDNWGRALADLKQPEAAIEHFRQALEMDPRDIAALNNWACGAGETRPAGRSHETLPPGVGNQPTFGGSAEQSGDTAGRSAESIRRRSIVFNLPCRTDLSLPMYIGNWLLCC